jgi:hypothetical protein
MKRIIVRFALFNIAVIGGVAVSLGTASAGGDSQRDFVVDPMIQVQQQTSAQVSRGVSDRIAQEVMPSVEEIMNGAESAIGGFRGFAGTPRSEVFRGGGIGSQGRSVQYDSYDSGGGRDSSGGRSGTSQDDSLMPQVNIGRVIDDALQSVTAERHNEMSDRITKRALTGLESGSNSMVSARRVVRDGIMYGRFRDIYPFASNNYRTFIQPYAINSMINQIRPDRFPDRFRSRMMPKTIKTMSDRIKPQQKAYMQEGIIGNPNFPDFPNEFYQGRVW